MNRNKVTAMLLIILLLLFFLPIQPVGAEENTVYATEDDIDLLAKLIYVEARGVGSVTEQAAVAWCVLNRVDSSRFPNSISAVIKQPHQFASTDGAPVTERFKAIAADVVMRWQLERLGIGESGRVLPKNYLFFAGRDGHNWFRTEYRGGGYWDWTMGSPYEEV